jgi:hypothetical protein
LNFGPDFIKLNEFFTEEVPDPNKFPLLEIEVKTFFMFFLSDPDQVLSVKFIPLLSPKSPK